MIGEMRDRVRIKAPTDIPDEGAGAISVYNTVIEDWTRVLPFSSRRQQENGQIVMVDGFDFTIRDRSSVTVDYKMLVEYDGNDYTISSIKPIKNRHRWLVITAITSGQPVENPVS